MGKIVDEFRAPLTVLIDKVFVDVDKRQIGRGTVFPVLLVELQRVVPALGKVCGGGIGQIGLPFVKGVTLKITRWDHIENMDIKTLRP